MNCTGTSVTIAFSHSAQYLIPPCSESTCPMTILLTRGDAILEVLDHLALARLADNEDWRFYGVASSFG